jgi:hypothetical protein
MTKYAFKTIVATEQIRAEFTALRDELQTSDKELMLALWNLKNKDELIAEVVRLQEQTVLDRKAKQEIKMAAKRAAKPEAKRGRPKKEKSEPVAKKAKRTKAVKEQVSNVSFEEDDDGFETVVVDGVGPRD